MLCLTITLTNSFQQSISSPTYSDTPLEHSPGLHYKDLGNLHLIKLFWRIITDIDLENYDKKFLLIKENLRQVSGICKHKDADIQIFCESYVETLTQTVHHIDVERAIVPDLIGHGRVKRAYVDLIGKISKTLFGTTEDAEHFEKLGVDLLGTFRRSSSCKTFVLLATDYVTLWVEARAIASGKAEPVANFIVENIICRHGSPRYDPISEESGILKECEILKEETITWDIYGDRTPTPEAGNSDIDDEKKSFLIHFCTKCYQFFDSVELFNTHNTSACTAKNSFKSLNRHMKKIHSGQMTFKCGNCPSAFSCKRYIPGRCHLLKHEAFSCKSHLLKHEEMHKVKIDKPHGCETCGKCFRMKFDLNRHMKIHTGEKPYACQICTKSFLDKSHLNVHLKTHARINVLHSFKALQN
ncbi:Zinc finger, C2H2 type [Popillia japonica]|uniref:Zinc finger, C2H2 type n=1 Tax=Popillia japonica TaxID=7064 RepID=A0AAW1N1C6_POPJA